MALAAAFAKQKAGKLCVVCERSIPADKYLRHIDSCRVSIDDDDCQVISSSSSSSSSYASTSKPTRRRSKDDDCEVILSSSSSNALSASTTSKSTRRRSSKENQLLTKCASSPESVVNKVTDIDSKESRPKLTTSRSEPALKSEFTEVKDELEPDDKLEGGPYFARYFDQILNDVIAPDTDFWSSMTDIVQRFRTLNDRAKQLFVRLFLRKPKWLVSSRLNYPQIASDLTPFFEELVDCGFADSGADHLSSTSDVLALMQLPALKSLAKVYHLDTTQARGTLVANLERQAAQKSIFGASLHDSMLKKAKTELGACFRIQSEVRRCFLAIFTVYAPCEMSSTHVLDQPSLNLPQQLLFTLLQVETSVLRFPAPTTINNRFKLYENMEDLLRYVDAKELETCIALKIASSNWEPVVEKAIEARTLLETRKKADCDTVPPDMLLPQHLRRFTERWVLTRCVWHGVEALQRLKRYTEAVDNLRFLLYGDSGAFWCPDSRGSWWDRLALNLDSHLRQKDEAMKIIADGFADAAVREKDKLLLQDRLERLNKGQAIEMVVCIREPIKKTIEGQLMHKDLGDSRVNRFVTSDNGLAVCSVESVAMEHYIDNEGFTEGLHGEGAPWHTLFGLLCYNVIFDQSVHGVWLSSLQTEPADINTPALYTSRQREFDAILEWIAEASNEQLKEKMEKVWTERQGEMNSQIHFDSFQGGLEQVQRLSAACGGRLLSAVFTRMVKDYRHTRSGFPDLTVWSADKVAVVEVKGPGDRLSTKQRLWLHFFSENGIDAHVCHVTGNKRRRID